MFANDQFLFYTMNLDFSNFRFRPLKDTMNLIVTEIFGKSVELWILQMLL